MVEFCPRCSNLLRRRYMDGEYYLICKCGYKIETKIETDDIKKSILKKKDELNNNIIIKRNDDVILINLKVLKTCPKCGYNEAVAWQEQTLSADEPSTSFFRFLKCNRVWREY